MDVRMGWCGDVRFTTETHHGAIPIIQFARLAVDDVALQRRCAPVWYAFVEFHGVGNRCRRHRYISCACHGNDFFNTLLEQSARFWNGTHDTNRSPRNSADATERRHHEELVPQRFDNVERYFDIDCGLRKRFAQSLYTFAAAIIEFTELDIIVPPELRIWPGPATMLSVPHSPAST